MFASLASLILDAIGLLLRSVELALPPPLQQMAPTLAHTRSCRRVSVGTEAMNATVHMSRLEIVNVRRAQELDTHMVNRIVAGGLTKYSETNSTEAGTYRRQDRQGTWLWSPPPGEPNARRLAALERLSAEVQWTTLDDEWISGHECMAYQALRGNGDDAWTQVLLWIAKDSLRPVEMLALSLRKGTSFDSATPPRPRTLSSQSVTWSDWDDPTLSIPPMW
ncbi:MAG TPA: hypothetical protein VNL35_03125 [Chloroflexota bacterium]|nr:hypothetical protein [Chloroflexota bacterium]